MCAVAPQSLALAHADITDDNVFFSPWCASSSSLSCLGRLTTWAHSVK